MKRQRRGVIFCAIVAVICSVCIPFLLDLFRSKGFPEWLVWVVVGVFDLCVLFLCYTALKKQIVDPQENEIQENERYLNASEEVPRWVRYGHTRKPNAIVRGLYVVFDWIADFFPMFAALFRFIRKTVVSTWSLAVRTFLVVVNFALLVGVIYVSVGHTYEFLTARAGASGISAFVLVFVWEAMFVYCSLRLDYAFRNGDENRSGAWIGFLMGWVFVELTNSFAMADNLYGRAVGLATPVVLLVMKKALKEQFMKQKKRSLLALWLTTIRKKIESKIIESKIFANLHKTSDNRITNETASERMTDEIMASETSSEAMASGDMTSETTSGVMTSEEMTSNTMTSITSETMTNEMTSEEMTNEKTSDIMTSEDMTSETITSGKMSSEVITSNEMTSNEMTNREKTSELMTSETSSEAMTSGDMTSETTSGVMTSEEMTSNTMTSITSETMTNEMTSEEMTNEKTSDIMTSNEMTSNRTGENTGEASMKKSNVVDLASRSKNRSRRKRRVPEEEFNRVKEVAIRYQQETGEKIGRPTLIELTGCTDYVAKEVLRQLKEELKQSS